MKLAKHKTGKDTSFVCVVLWNQKDKSVDTDLFINLFLRNFVTGMSCLA